MVKLADSFEVIADSRCYRHFTKYTLLIVISLFSQPAFSQTDSLLRQVEFKRTLPDESLISSQTFIGTDEDIFGEQLQFIVDDMERIAMHPVQLQNATWQDLQNIPTLSGLDIAEIIHSKQNNIPLGSDILHKVRSFTRNSSDAESISFRTRAVLDPEAHNESVYQNGTYQGNPIKTSSRLIAKTDGILFSMTEAKDPGEPLYFDHLTGCAAIYNPVAITDDISLPQCVIGDYSLSFGQGLLFSSGYSPMPHRNVNASIEPHTSGIQPYISSSSFRYFRGAGSEVRSGSISASGFFSDRKIDATVNSDTITSLYSNGYHRTTSEIARENQAEARVAGGHISVVPLHEDSYAEFGATGYTLSYDKPVTVKDSTSLGFHGQHHAMFSAETRGVFSFISWNGEYAGMNSDAGKANAFALSAITAPFKFLEISANYHDLPANFISPFGGTFGMNSGTAQNERGLYLGSKFTIAPNTLTLFSSVNFSQSDKTTGEIRYTDFHIRSAYSFQPLPLRLSAAFQSFSKGHIFQISGDSLSKKSFRFDAEANLSETMSIGLRTEFQRYYSDTTLGYLIGIRWSYIPLGELSFSSGVSFFDASSYTSRFYSNEDDLPGLSSYLSLYGIGYRYYIGITYEAGPLSLSGRLGETRYSYEGRAMQNKAIGGVQCDIAF